MLEDKMQRIENRNVEENDKKTKEKKRVVYFTSGFHFNKTLMIFFYKNEIQFN